jgi:uncharacterized membrane protein
VSAGVSAVHAAGQDTGSGNREIEAKAADRVVVFSDAVVAIAITLLALALPVPDGTSDTTNGQLLHAPAQSWGDYFAFLISFAVIGGHWATHRRVFRYVSRLNGQVSTLNMLWLLMVILTPFAARMLAGHGGFAIRFGTYALIQVLSSSFMVAMSRELVRKDLLRPDAPESARLPDNAHSISVIVAFLVSIPVAFVTGGAYALWVAGPVMTQALLRLRRRRLRRRDPGATHLGRHASR